jgi:hypothetical protein
MNNREKYYLSKIAVKAPDKPVADIPGWYTGGDKPIRTNTQEDRDFQKLRYQDEGKPPTIRTSSHPKPGEEMVNPKDMSRGGARFGGRAPRKLNTTNTHPSLSGNEFVFPEGSPHSDSDVQFGGTSKEGPTQPPPKKLFPAGKEVESWDTWERRNSAKNNRRGNSPMSSQFKKDMRHLSYDPWKFLTGGYHPTQK